MSNRKKLIVSVFSLVLCILVTFAWINELQNPEGRVLALRFKDASIATSELSVKLSFNVKDNEYKDITKYKVDGVQESLKPFQNFAPGSRQKFRVDIANLSSSPVTLRLILSDIICKNKELAEKIIVGTNGYAGFTSTYPEPAVQTEILADGMGDSTSFVLLDKVQVPPNNANAPVSVYFYVMFSATGREQFENSELSIGTINFLTI